MSIDNKLTPNELAKLEMWRGVELSFFDGVKGSSLAGDKVTEKEEDETNRHLNKHMRSLRKQWGMDKIFNKMGWDR